MEKLAHQGVAEPQGGRIGVAFDWGFGVQLASIGLISIFGGPLPAGMPSGVVSGLGMLGVAALAFGQGEALRRGKGWARYVQMAGNGALTVVGLASLPVLLRQLEGGDLSGLYTYLLLVGVSPAEVWLLLQPGSRQWYGSVSDEEALARHSGPWLRGTVAWAVVCGLLQTGAAYLQQRPT
jgi:hypothetical protein